MRESNLPPGGLDTVRRFAVELGLGPHTNVLHAGCNSGFLSRELARRTGCQVLGIDISPDMAAAANARSESEGLAHLARYEHRDMRDTGLDAASFDVVLSGGALAFVIDQPRAVAEWLRLVKPHGLVANSELWYHAEPPQQLLDKVAELIGVPVPRYTRDHWRELYNSPRLQPWALHDAEAGARTVEEVERYCAQMVDHVAVGWDDSAREALNERLLDIFLTFNQNMEYLSYTFFAYRVLPAGAEPLLYV
ncbi:Ubiquinone/menaquinone biosynthesis C-methylase UbiE [Actinokineospora alba]|uniref:Ubiquinone/menaquinone biosynthesis C-methylase UbiE n=2 Tax=Actinokineospora alba TaxID=504798 RepID=A0A1H0HEH1_9PSEU|nr:ubiquinone/menaquinone biosynthesis C-methylase UbiE [Actinokineospora alba]SDH49349.1 Ubiquinone/menaquinone biosynthesis C-methylase UbiE [Actinokineospora alba]SDO17565.1 Ubiquinone/menaquinone biosynthesis C-methylase UbiE [Actinokineospora alba]